MRIHEHEHEAEHREEQHGEEWRQEARARVIVNFVGRMRCGHAQKGCIRHARRSQQLDQHHDGTDEETDVHEHHDALHRGRILRGRSARWDDCAAWTVADVGPAYEFSADQTAKAPRSRAS